MMFSLYQATGLTSQELSEVFQNNPRAYMAVRGAVAEKHLEKVLVSMLESGHIDEYQGASGDMDKDFLIKSDSTTMTLECKNVEVIKTSNKKMRASYIEYLVEEGYLSGLFIEAALSETNVSSANFQELSSFELAKVFKKIPQEYRESGIAKYQYSASKVQQPQLGQLSDAEFVAQFEDFPLTIDFQRTRNSTDEEGGTRRNRYYRIGEIDIVAACLFSRTMEWRFLYAKAKEFQRHSQYSDRYSNRLKLAPGVWTSDLIGLIAT